MIDKNLEKKIKQTEDFLELWVKFHDLYRGATTKGTIVAEDEKVFLDTKSLIARKYQALIDALGITQGDEERSFNVISQVLSLERVSTMSDMQMREIEDSWHNSYIALNKLLGGLENEKEELAKISRTGLAMKKIFSSSLMNLVLIVVFVFSIFYIIKLFHIDEKIRTSLTVYSEQEANK